MRNLTLLETNWLAAINKGATNDRMSVAEFIEMVDTAHANRERHERECYEKRWRARGRDESARAIAEKFGDEVLVGLEDF